jgi:hypothetical protein
MHLMFVAEGRRMIDDGGSALAALVLLALGTFTAGIQLRAWRICLLGALMAAGVPGVVWLGRTALLVLLGTLALAAIAAAIIWHMRRGHKADGGAVRPGTATTMDDCA